MKLRAITLYKIYGFCKHKVVIERPDGKKHILSKYHTEYYYNCIPYKILPVRHIFNYEYNGSILRDKEAEEFIKECNIGDDEFV